MGNKSYLVSLVLLLSSIGVHLFLSLRSYSIKTDQTNFNFCQIGDYDGCTTALSSSFSDIFGLPLSIFGLVLSLICLGLLLLIRWGFLEARWSFWTFALSLLGALASFVMLLISVFIVKTFCLGCSLIYVFSFILPFTLKKALPPIEKPAFSIESVKGFFKLALTGVFLLFLSHALITQFFPVNQSVKAAAIQFADWKSSPQSSPPKSRLLSLKSPASKWTLIEVVDFLCFHCKRVDQVLSSFHKTNPEVKVLVLGFPLDPKGCLEKEESLSSNCYLAQAVWCAEVQKKGEALKKVIYENQASYQRSSISDIKAKMKEALLSLDGDFSQFKNCIGSAQARQALSEQIRWGMSAGVRGTPTLFFEGRRIESQAIHLTLQKIIKSMN